MATIGTIERGNSFRFLYFFTFSLVILAISSITGTAAAQEEKNARLEQVVVTGSRISRAGFDSPSPVTVIDAEQIGNLGLVNTGDIMRTIPQNTPFFTEANVGIGNFNVGAQLANLRGLNPFFGTRTLTLVNTRRVVPNTEGGAVDLTLIPSMLVARTEVVTGGASAAYGSDAIAGVVNVILDTELNKTKASIDYGETFQGDGGDLHASFATGTGFAGDRGNLIIGVEYQNLDAIGPCSRTRGWCQEAWAVGTNPAYAAGNGAPNYVVAPDAKFPTSETGLFTPFGGVQQQFNTDGTALLPYDPGKYGGVFARIGGDGTVKAYDLSNIRPDTERVSFLAHVKYNFTDTTEGFTELDYAHSNTENFPANGALGPLALVIAPDNAYLTPAVQAAAPFGGFFARIFMPDVISARNTTEAGTTRFVAGLDGEFNFMNLKKWNWDAYYQYGHSVYHQKLFHNATGGLLAPFISPSPEYDFLGWAIDAVHSDPLDPTSPIVCRATLPGPFHDSLANGCKPLNLFGIGNADPEAIDYAYRTLKEDSTYDQHVIAGNVRGTLFQGWAGPINAAAGIEWRHDRAKVTHDMENQPWYDAYFLDWGLDRGGIIKVLEGYGEVNVPLLNNRPAVKSLEVDLAVRYTRNEAISDDISVPASTHTFSSWKASGVYDVNDWLRFRGSRSRDVRAAGFRELFLPRVETVGVPGSFPAGINNPWNGNAAESYLSITGGNPGLKPEKADTSTIGIVLQPDNILKGLRLSVDWFEIDLADAITPGGLGGLSAQQLVDACFASGGTGEVCSKVSGFGTNDITAVDATSINIGSFLTRGIDFEAVYNTPLNRFSDVWKGNLNMRVIASYLYDMIIDTGLGSPANNYHGQSGPVASFGGFNTQPDWQARVFLTYSLDRFTTTLETRYIGEGTLNALWFDSPAGAASNTQINSVTDNSVDSMFYLTLSGSYKLPVHFLGSDRSVEVFGVINNLLDSDPPVAPGGNSYPTNPVFFDTYGARFRVGMRVEF